MSPWPSSLVSVFIEPGKPTEVMRRVKGKPAQAGSVLAKDFDKVRQARAWKKKWLADSRVVSEPETFNEKVICVCGKFDVLPAAIRDDVWDKLKSPGGPDHVLAMLTMDQ